MTKLSAAQKQQIRQQWETKTSRELQDEFGCSKSTIRRVMQEGGETSKCLPAPLTCNGARPEQQHVTGLPRYRNLQLRAVEEPAQNMQCDAQEVTAEHPLQASAHWHVDKKGEASTGDGQVHQTKAE